MVIDVLVLPKHDQTERVHADLQRIVSGYNPIREDYGDFEGMSAEDLERAVSQGFSLISLQINEERGIAYAGLQAIMEISDKRTYFVAITELIGVYGPISTDLHNAIGINMSLAIESGTFIYHLFPLDMDSREKIILPTDTETGYVAWREIRGPDNVVLYLAQILAPGYEAGEHEHAKPATPSVEIYVPLGGTSSLNDENEIITLTREDRHSIWRAVKPGHAHQIRNDENPALNLLFMSPAPEGRYDRIPTSRLDPW